ncbi:hypothetical protein V493_07662, partial [Pseudogymnoascus sp. VKM F-4281 (FW-2241)]
LPLPSPRYSEHYAINPYDADVARAHELLEAHMKNRWAGVLSANQALQDITGTSGGLGAGEGRDPVAAAKAATAAMGMDGGDCGLSRAPRPLLPGFGTPMQVAQRMRDERVGKVRSLRAVYEEYVTLPHARAVDLSSLSIHAVSGFFDGGNGGGNPQQPVTKMQNELLAHYTEVEGATSIQLLEVDMPNPTGGGNRHPFERWAFFVIAMPVLCGPGGVDMGFVGGHERASMMIAAPMSEVVVDGGKAVESGVLG